MNSRVLVTGFEPFGEDSTNSSQRILDALAGDGKIVVKVLPVDRDRQEVTPEKVAINLCALHIPDNCGNQPLDEQVAAIREAIRVTRTAPRRSLPRSTGAAPLP